MPIISKDSYQPPLWLFNAHLQTIVPALFRNVDKVFFERKRIDTPDGDFLDLDWYKKESDHLVILSHGLEGDSQRPYIKGMVKTFTDYGWDALAWNFRGCSGEVNMLKRFYHSGATEDLHEVIQFALSTHLYKKISLIGFSLGANLTLKYLGEYGSSLPGVLDKAVVFSVPMDLYGSCKKISQKRNFIYSRRFLNHLQQKVALKAKVMPGVFDMEVLQKVKNLKEFDDAFTAPLHGFQNALDYYQKNSALGFLEFIPVPVLIINAQNDPMLSKDCFPFEEARRLPNIHFFAPQQGGHCGFWPAGQSQIFWSEFQALSFLSK
jgi:uncharacterized protein